MEVSMAMIMVVAVAKATTIFMAMDTDTVGVATAIAMATPSHRHLHGADNTIAIVGFPCPNMPLWPALVWPALGCLACPVRKVAITLPACACLVSVRPSWLPCALAG